MPNTISRPATPTANKGSPLVFNQNALGSFWHLFDLPTQWPGYDILAFADFNRNLDLDNEERRHIDWLAFTQCVTDFQRDQHLSPTDGKLGPNTLKKLQAFYADVHPDSNAPQNHRNTQPVLMSLAGRFDLLPPTKLTAPPSQAIALSSDPQEASIGRLWNRYGAAIAECADQHNLSVDRALAVFQVESKQAYDLDTGLVLIRFESHIFKRYTQRNIDNAHSNQSHEWRALQQASEHNLEAALLSTSFGLPQLMGFNWKFTQHPSVEKMVQAFQDSCEAQIQGFFDFIVKQDLLKHLQKSNWPEFVRRYNGPGNVADYTEKLTRALTLVSYLEQDGAQWVV
jgi:hypothetical protein